MDTNQNRIEKYDKKPIGNINKIGELRDCK